MMNSTNISLDRLGFLLKGLIFAVLLAFVVDAFVLPYVQSDTNAVLIELNDVDDTDSSEEGSEKEKESENHWFIEHHYHQLEIEGRLAVSKSAYHLPLIIHFGDIPTPPPEQV